MERQKHGFDYEKQIIARERLIPSPKYNGPIDAYKQCGPARIPVSIKLTKLGGEICLGSYPDARIVKDDFILHLGFWNGTKTNIVDERAYFIPAQKWRDQCHYTEHKSMMEELKLQTNLREDDDKWKEYMARHQDAWDREQFRYLRLRFKRDHKSQKRIQLAIPKADQPLLYSKFTKVSLSEFTPDLLSSLTSGSPSLSLSSFSDSDTMTQSERYSKKSSLDQFYTKPEIAQQLIAQFVGVLRDQCGQIQTILEPSAGSGSFSNHFHDELWLSSSAIIALDIAPAHSSIEQADFLQLDLTQRLTGPTAVIGNPPFGKQCSDAIKFFNTSADYEAVQWIAFILPASFKKDSVQNRLNLDFKLIHQCDMDPDSFILNGQAYRVPCIFQIWERADEPRIKAPKHKPNGHYEFVDTLESANLVFRRVGVYAGRCISTNQGDYSVQSHYFIKCKVDPQTVAVQMSEIEWPANDTAGPRSISKNDLIRELNIITEGMI